MKKIFLSGAVLLCLFTARAQYTYDYLKAADNYYTKADYNSAAEYYEKYLKTAKPIADKDGYNPYAVQTPFTKKKTPVSSRLEALYKLAESYRLLNFPAKAEVAYKQVLDTDEKQYPLAGYYYATALRALEKYEEAEKGFTHFLDNYKTDDTYSEAARKEILSLRFIQSQLNKKDLKLYSLAKAAAPLNVKGANYAPAWLDEQTLLFTSTRADSASGDKKHVYVNRVYQAAYHDGVASAINKTNVPEINNAHQGVASISADGKTMYLTRWTIIGAVKKSAIYTSVKNGESWSAPVLLDSIVNATGYSAQQPFVMADGKYLLFASDKPGGFGGFDLWYAELDASGKPVKVENLGEAVNSGGDELAPYYHTASKTLVFSGNGRIGMGGYDFFYSKGAPGNFRAPVNFGYPVNSVKDDVYFVSKGKANNILEEVVLSSDRSAECCLELFWLNKKKPLKQVSGLVLNCDNSVPLAGARISIIDTIQHKTIYTKTTDADGSYSFNMEEYQPLKAVAMLDGYDTAALHFYTPADEEADSLNNPSLCLIKEAPPIETVVVIENVYYDFDKSDLKEESYPALDIMVNMMNNHPTMVIEIGAHTDNKGSDAYNQRLSNARAARVVAYLVSKGIDKARLQAKGYGATIPVAANTNEDGSDNPEGRQQNRRTEFKVISK